MKEIEGFRVNGSLLEISEKRKKSNDWKFNKVLCQIINRLTFKDKLCNLFVKTEIKFTDYELKCLNIINYLRKKRKLSDLLREWCRLSLEMLLIWTSLSYNNCQIIYMYLDDGNEWMLGLHQLIERQWHYVLIGVVDVKVGQVKRPKVWIENYARRYNKKICED
jgi:hypothetical protein